jgi:hypothetical protein
VCTSQCLSELILPVTACMKVVSFTWGFNYWSDWCVDEWSSKCTTVDLSIIFVSCSKMFRTNTLWSLWSSNFYDFLLQPEIHSNRKWRALYFTLLLSDEMKLGTGSLQVAFVFPASDWCMWLEERNQMALLWVLVMHLIILKSLCLV